LYCEELDPSGVNQFVLVAPALSSSKPYWSSDPWNGQYFNSVPKVSRDVGNQSFVDNTHEKYYTYEIANEETIMYNMLGVYGQLKTFIWLEGSPAWVCDRTAQNNSVLSPKPVPLAIKR
jgi:hypothetical protein